MIICPSVANTSKMDLNSTTYGAQLVILLEAFSSPSQLWDLKLLYTGNFAIDKTASSPLS